MHLNQVLYCCAIRGIFPEYFKGDILDVGSLDVNGNNRYLRSGFNSRYLGVDIQEGKNVDIVTEIYRFSEYHRNNYDRYDLVLCTEMLEHDKHWDWSLGHMVRLLKPHGLLVFTCATTGRPEHGTHRSQPESSPATNDYYQNITEEMVREVPGFIASFDYHKFSVNGTDLRFWGITGKLNYRPSIIGLLIPYCKYFFSKIIRDIKNFLNHKQCQIKTYWKMQK
jgi:SAM-dependent methyltransferase